MKIENKKIPRWITYQLSTAGRVILYGMFVFLVGISNAGATKISWAPPGYACVGSSIDVSASVADYEGDWYVTVSCSGYSATATNTSATLTIPAQSSATTLSVSAVGYDLNGNQIASDSSNIVVLAIASVTGPIIACYSSTVTFTATTAPVDGNPGGCTITWSGTASPSGSGLTATAGTFSSGGSKTVTASIGGYGQSATISVSKILIALSAGSGTTTSASPGETKVFNCTATGALGTMSYTWALTGGGTFIVSTGGDSATATLPAGTYSCSVTVFDLSPGLSNCGTTYTWTLTVQ